MDREKYGVHISHCCYIHGCKYGDEDCPVVSGEVAQKHLCYDCSEEYEPYTLEEIEQLRKTKSYRPTYKQLKTKVADLEAKLEESEKTEDGAFWFEKWQHKKRDYDSVYKAYIENCAEVDQLKQQLEESEKKVDEFHDKLLDEIQNKVDREVELTNCLNNVVDERDQLKQQLEEKDQAIESLQEINQSLGQTCNNDAKEIERLNNLLKEEKNRNKKLNHEAQKYYEDAYCNDFQNQTAIAELQKVLEWLNIPFDENGCLKNGEDLENYIDQQIAELKGEK